ncbi:MAG TPA: tubulin-like doman-containing protein, partial [Thermoanaerobaculia bacterium]
GSRIVDRIASRVALLPNWESQLLPLTSFVSIDTNELDQHRLRNIPDGNRLNIAAFDKAKAIDHFRRSEDQQALQWLDPEYKPRSGIKPGAGQIRVESRLGFFFHSLDIRQRIKELVTESLRPGITWRQTGKFNIYLYCTLAGGTGSGSFLSTAYLIDSILRDQHWQPRIIANLLLSTLMVDKVGTELHPDIHANTYAALKELEFLTKLDYKNVVGAQTEAPFVYCRDENSRKVQIVSSRPFFISFVFDRPPHLSLPDSEAAIADASFLQIFTPVIGNVAGEYDNYEKHLEGLTHFPGPLKDLGNGYTMNFGAFGAAALVLPAQELLEYVALRFAAQAIRGQITFSVDQSDPSDDRARALARLAVNYSDPKFLNMSDEGRERVLHQSFVASVQEMARQDRNQDLLDGFWYTLVESIDDGRQTGVDEKGEAVRAESVTKLVERKLEEGRRDLLNKVSIKERALVFHREGVNQYVEVVSRLIEDIRGARSIVDEGVRGLEASAGEGEAISELKLDPIAERYLIIRLLDRCEKTLIPEAQQQLDKAKARDIGNPKVRERLEREQFETLREIAGKRRLFRGDQDFLAARDEAQETVRSVASAARQTFDAEIRLRQLRALREYLQRRSRQYARLATRMDVLVQELEREAERLRRGETVLVPPFALRVEVFETLDEPRQRIWDRVYRTLFLDGGRYLATFDRQMLAEAISRELKPVVRPDGTVAEKTLDQTVSDLRRALCELGRQRMRPAIYGQVGQPGLDLVSGLELEAQLMLQPKKRPGETVTGDDVEAYREKKFRALPQVAGLLARVSSSESKALDDGVPSNHSRQIIIGLNEAGMAAASERFSEQLKSVLSAGIQVKVDDEHWHDPRLIIVHDVQLPIPLYYLNAVTGEIEDAYLKIAANEQRSYHLHTDFNWEKALANLNPQRSEITVGWSLVTLAEGLLTGVLQQDVDTGVIFWPREDAEPYILGHDLAGALYGLGKIHSRTEHLQQRLEKELLQAREAMDAAERHNRARVLVDQIARMLEDSEGREQKGSLSRQEMLEKPVLRALHDQIGKQPDWSGSPAGKTLRRRFNSPTP